MEDAGLGRRVVEEGQGWGNNRWLWHMGSCPGWKHCSHPLPSSETPDLRAQSSGPSYRRINRALIDGQSCLCQEEAPPSPSTRILVGTGPEGTVTPQAGYTEGSPQAGRNSLPTDVPCLHKFEQGKVRLILNLNKQGEKAMPELALLSRDAQPQSTAPAAQLWPAQGFTSP